jgi:hypothetical protein
LARSKKWDAVAGQRDEIEALRAKIADQPPARGAADRTREQRLRRMAERQGYKLSKSGRRDPRAIDYDRWCIVDPQTNAIVAGTGSTGRPNMRLDDVEAWLTP